MNLQQRTSIEHDFAEAAQETFSEMLEFTFTSGSFAYCGATEQSDLDIITVLKETIDREELFEAIKRFIAKYIQIHKDHGFKPDTTWPGEYTTQANLKDAITGRGFLISPKRKLILPPGTNQELLANNESYYPIWLCMLALSRRIIGDERGFLKLKRNAWQTIILFLLCNSQLEVLSPQKIIEKLRETHPAIFKPSYRTLEADESPHIQQALTRLEMNQLIGGNQPKPAEIEKWRTNTIDGIKSQSIRRAHFLLSRKQETNLAKLASSLWHRSTSSSSIFTGSMTEYEK